MHKHAKVFLEFQAVGKKKPKFFSQFVNYAALSCIAYILLPNTKSVFRALKLLRSVEQEILSKSHSWTFTWNQSLVCLRCRLLRWSLNLSKSFSLLTQEKFYLNHHRTDRQITGVYVELLLATNSRCHLGLTIVVHNNMNVGWIGINLSSIRDCCR